MPANHLHAALTVPATLMRGGTSKGLFFNVGSLPGGMACDPAQRDQFILRVMGSPDPYGSQIDGLGGATPSTSKVVLVGPSERPDIDVEYFFGAVPIGGDAIDWSGNCGNLTAAVGSFALHEGIVSAANSEGIHRIRMWQVNICREIVAHIPVSSGVPVESGHFHLDGVAFGGAEIALEFLEGGNGTSAFPTGAVVDQLGIDGLGMLSATLTAVGAPTIFLPAASIGLSGREDAAELDAKNLKATFERIRVAGSLRLGVAATPEEAAASVHTPRLALVAPPADFVTSSGVEIAAGSIDLLVRMLSVGRLHASMTGTGAVALAAAAAAAGTTVADALRGGQRAQRVTFGHPAGRMTVGAAVNGSGAAMRVESVRMSRSARRLMSGTVHYAPIDA